mmetsp:Transcript_108636/g.307220  ORF Transcript_108636/g.307220 Transcript_108636/m.307220 type:complete len:192 (+) Transcript_108636:107-682(+)
MVEPPQMPQMKLSQIAPMIVMFGLTKYDLVALGYARYVEAGYIAVQLVCLAVLGRIYLNIGRLSDDGRKIPIPAVVQLGQTIAPATEQTPKEYDLSQWSERAKQLVIGCMVVGFVYYKWRYLMALVLQLLMTPLQLYEHPLVQIHILGKEVARPFPQQSLLPTMPTAPAAQETARSTAKATKKALKASKKA